MMSREEDRLLEAMRSILKHGTMDRTTPTGAIVVQRLFDKGYIDYDGDTNRMVLTVRGHAEMTKDSTPMGEVIVGRFPAFLPPHAG